MRASDECRLSRMLSQVFWELRHDVSIQLNVFDATYRWKEPFVYASLVGYEMDSYRSSAELL